MFLTSNANSYKKKLHAYIHHAVTDNLLYSTVNKLFLLFFKIFIKGCNIKLALILKK